MIVIVSGPETDESGISEDTKNEISYLDFYISHHPSYFGLIKLGDKLGLINEKNMTNGLYQYVKNMVKSKDERVAPYFMPHPLYVELQQRSPLGMLRDYNVTEIDMNNQTIGKHEFY